MSAPRLELRQVFKTYSSDGQKVEALRGVSLRVEAGTMMALVGRSGCGKSTLLNLAGAMDFPTSGEVLIDGRPTTALTEGELTFLRRTRIGFVFQFFQLLPTLTVLENVELPLLLAGRGNTSQPALDRLRWVGLADRAQSLPHQLSGGQMQRVAIARALAHSPEVLIADEPTGNLDTASGDQALKLLRECADRFGAAVLLATHSAEAAAIADIRVRLRDGSVAEIDPGVRAISSLLWTFIVRPLRRDLVRTSLTVVSVALGVAVVIAIELAGEAAVGSFRSSLETLLGKTDLQITANGGVDEIWAARLAQMPRNLRISPVIEIQAVIEGIGSVPVYGVDLLAQGRPGQEAGVGISRALANRIGISTNKAKLTMQINDRRLEFAVAGIVEAKEAEFVLMDVADAQKAAGSYGKLDRIDIFVSPRENFAALEADIRAMLPASYSLDRPGVRGEENQRMLRAFRWNLRVLSYISLIVGAFLIYNTISVSVVRRRPEIGILRALGAGRWGVLWLFLGEALLLGLAGSLAGVVLGRIFAAGAVGLIGDTVNSLYSSSRPAAVELTPGAALLGIVAGAVVALASAFAPAREAMAVAPVSAMGRGAYEHQAHIHWARDLIWSGVLALGALGASQVGPVDGTPVWGYLAALLAIGSAAMAAPALVLLVTRLAKSAARRLWGAEGLLAVRGLAASLSRTSVIVGALATAIAMMASVGIMVGSFRETVLVWLDQQLRADLYVRPAGRTGAGQFPALSPQLPKVVSAVPGVEAVDIFHGMEFRYQGQRAMLGAGDIDIVRSHGRLRFLSSSRSRDSILLSLPHRDNVIVSEPFANKHNIHPGDRLTLPLGEHAVTFMVAGIYYDYSTELGWVILDRSTLLRYLPAQPITNLAVYLQSGVDATSVRHRIEAAVAGYRIVVAENKTLRSAAVVVFDRTFAITYALEAVAIVVAMLGAANSLLALVLDRRRELGLLRFLGAAPEQIRRMVLIEAGFLGLLADLLGLALGFALSLLLIYVVNKQSFGWTIQFHPPVGLLAGALSLIWLATVAAGLYPARVAARLNPIEVVHLE